MPRPNVDPTAQDTWMAYGCIKCQVMHFEDSPLYKAHMLFQSKEGMRTVTASERAAHLTASDQSTEEPPEQDIRNALMLLEVLEPVSVPLARAGVRELAEEDYQLVVRRLHSAVEKLERLARAQNHRARMKGVGF